MTSGHPDSTAAGFWGSVVNRARRQVSLTVLGIALGVLLLATFVVMFGGLENYYYTFGVHSKREVLQVLGLTIGVVLVAIQAVAAHRRAAAMELAVTAQTRAVKEQAAAVKEHATANRQAEQGQRQERLKDAIGELGHRSVAVRLGGAYQLYHLASESEEFRRTVLDVLCAHIRQTTRTKEYRKEFRFEPSVEIQTLLTLLFDKGHSFFGSIQSDLHRSHLVGSNLANAHLEGANLTEVRLAASLLRGAHLQGALLSRSYLHWADLTEAHMQGAVLHHSHLQCSDLLNAEFQGASIGGASLQGSNLTGAKFHGARLWTDYGTPSQSAARTAVSRSGHALGARIPTFRERIKSSIGRPGDLSQTNFSGGTEQQDVDNLSKDLGGEHGVGFRERMARHVGPRLVRLSKVAQPNFENGKYDNVQAQLWIDAYPICGDDS